MNWAVKFSIQILIGIKVNDMGITKL